MTHVFHRQLQHSLPRAVAGDGAYIIDENGKRYLDASCGAAVSCLGHNHPAVITAIKEQLDKIPFAHTAFFTSEAAEELADVLVDKAPDGISHVYFVCGGSEAMEAALKLARQYWLERGQTQRKLFISRKQSYHGNTLGALAVGGNFWRREPYDGLLMETHHISACYAYRGKMASETEHEYGQRVANELEEKVLELGAENVIGFVAEPVVGATLGAVAAVPGYFKRIREICDQYDILLIFDEVMCGMGRTGTLFACEQENVTADLITIAKGLGAGYQPIGALLASEKIYESVKNGSGFFQHGHTYLGHTSACAAALAVQKTIAQDNLLENVRTQGQFLLANLQERFQNNPFVGDVRGRGLFCGIELVENKKTKKPFPPELGLHKLIKQYAMENGLTCYPMGGTLDGKFGNHVLLAPPFIIEATHTEEITGKISKAIERATARLYRQAS